MASYGSYKIRKPAMKNLRSFLTKNIGVLFLVLLVTIFAYPYIFLGKTPFPSDYMVNHFPPWSSSKELWGPVKNGAMPDIVDQIYPWRHFSVEELSKGEVAYWNPNSFSGNPHLANFQSSFFSPFNLIFLILPFVNAWTILIIAQPLIAGLSMYALLRSFQKSKAASVLGGISFMFCGFIVVWMAYGTLAMAISALPLALCGAKKYSDTKKTRFAVLLSLSIAFSFLSGHFQTSLYLLAYVSAFCVFLRYKAFLKKDTLFLFSFIILGVAISLIQLLPTVQFYLLAVRSESFITGGGVPFDHLITLIAPDFFGNPVTRNDWVGYYAEWAMFVGIIPLLFALTSLLKPERAVRFTWFMLFAIAFLALNSPVQGVLGSLKLPVVSTSNPSRIIVLLSFSFAFLSGFGFDTFLSLLKSKRLRKLIIIFILIGTALLAVWIFLLTNPFPDPNNQLARKNLILPTALFGALALSSVVAYKLIKRKNILLAFSAAVILLAGFDSLRFAMKWMPVSEKDKVFIDLPVIKAMQDEVGHGRVFGNLGAQVDTYFNLPSVEGYDPLYIGRYGEFIRASIDGKIRPAERSVVKLDRKGKYTDRVIDLLGVEIVFHPIADTNQSWAYPVWADPERFEEVYKDNKFQVFRNNTAISRGTVYYDVEVITDAKDILERFYSEDFDFRNALILEKDPGLVKSEKNTKGEIELAKDDAQHIIFRVKTDREGMLFLSDNFYPGWRASVNGEDVEVYRANYAFRAVKVPVGESVVEFYYRFGF